MRSKWIMTCFLATAMMVFSCSDDDEPGKDAAGADLGLGDLVLDQSPPDVTRPDLSDEVKPRIDQILPADGLTNIQTTVNLVGDNFAAPATVYINGGEHIISNVSVASATSMSFTMPENIFSDPGTAYKVSIKVKVSDMYSNIIYFQYTVALEPTAEFQGVVVTGSMNSFRDFPSDPIIGEVVATGDVTAQVGIGTVGANPTEAGGWKWYPAEETPAGSGSYAGPIVAPLAQTYDVAYRFSADMGKSWIYVDTDDSNLAYQPTKAGKLVVEKAPSHYCLEDDHCVLYGFRVVCKKDQDKKKNVCVQCLDNADCSGNPKALGPNCESTQNICYCSGDPECVDNPNGAVCSESGYCGCQSHDNCISPRECTQVSEELIICK